MKRVACVFSVGALGLFGCGGGGDDDDDDIIVFPDANTDQPDAPPSGECNPVAQSGCAAGEKCALILDDVDTGAGHVGCIMDGTAAIGEACTDPVVVDTSDSCLAGGDPSSAVAARLKSRFGAVDRWLADFVAAAKSARGWAMLVAHPVNGKLYNVVSDSHDDGIVTCGNPVVVIDCYEHAFYVDYQNRKADYADAYTGYINWAELDRRFKRLS